MFLGIASLKFKRMPSLADRWEAFFVDHVRLKERSFTLATCYLLLATFYLLSVNVALTCCWFATCR